jgi:hypothetical protein
MAEATLAFESTDLFDFSTLDAGFHPQTSSTSISRERDMNLANDGDVACESAEFNVITAYSCEYKFCEPAVAAGLREALATVLTQFGDIRDSKAITSIELSFNNKEYPTLSIEGHNHAVNPHLTDYGREFDVSTIVLPATFSGVGIPAIPDVTVAANNAIQSATISISMEHMEVEGSTGDHFASQNRTCRVDLSLSGVGPDSGITYTASTWVKDDESSEDANTDPDSFSISVHRYVDAT